MTIYLDKENHVYTTAAEGRVAAETTAFDGMPTRAIECYKYFNNNGAEFVQAFIPASEMANQYTMGELEGQNAELVDAMAAMVEEVYQSDTETIGG
jgi:hypothetical protein